MTWLKLDVGFFTHPKVIGLTGDAQRLYLAGLCYCAAHATDGRLATAAIRVIAAEVDVKPKLAGSLVAAGLWHEDDDGFEVHDYAEHQRDAETVKRQRANNRERVRAFRERQRNGVTAASRNAERVALVTPTEESREEEPPPPQEVTHDLDLFGFDASEEQRFEAAVQLIARRRLDRRRTVEPKITNESRWMARVVADIRSGEAERAARLFKSSPKIKPERLAELLEVPPDAPEFARRKQVDPSCRECGGTGWIEDQPGAVDRCTCETREGQ